MSKKFGLLEETIENTFKENIVYDLPINIISPYDGNEFELSEVEYFTSAIKEYGQKTPITVCIDTMQVIDGNQRYYAMLQNESKTIKAIFKKYEDDLDRKISHYIANEHRKNFKPSTLAKAIYDISIDLSKRGYNKGEIENHLGKHYGYADRTIRRYLILATLEKDIRDKFDSGEYKMSNIEKIKNGEYFRENKKRDTINEYLDNSNAISEKLNAKVKISNKTVTLKVKDELELNILINKLESLS